MMNEQNLLPESPTLFHLTQLAVIQLEGEDAVKYLNGQVTCDVTKLAIGDSTFGAHCTPKGKVLAIFRVFKTEQALYLVYKKELIEKELTELKKYAVFSKVTITDVSERYSVLGFTAKNADNLKQSFESLNLSQIATVSVNPNRIMMIVDSELAFAHPLNTESSCWFGLDILDGIPNINANIQDEFIPQAFNLDAIDGISFTKGCYTGQETVARAKYRGTNNRSMFVLEGSSSIPVTIDDQLEKQIGDNWRSSGSIVDVYQDGEFVIMTAILPHDTAPETSFRMMNNEASNLKIRSLPYSL